MRSEPKCRLCGHADIRELDASYMCKDHAACAGRRTTGGPPVTMCKCRKNLAREPHACPFKADVHGDDNTLCTCCKDCSRECLYDI